jgi:hypothetical protein
VPSASNPAYKRYTLRIGLFMTAYVVLLVGINFLLRAHPLGTMGRSLVAILPALPLLGVFWAIGRLIVELRDEYQRARFIAQILWATAFTLSVTTVWGFVESVGGLPHLNPFYNATLWFGGLGAGAIYRRVTER